MTLRVLLVFLVLGILTFAAPTALAAGGDGGSSASLEQSGMALFLVAVFGLFVAVLGGFLLWRTFHLART